MLKREDDEDVKRCERQGEAKEEGKQEKDGGREKWMND